jgi:hypothetical protein
MARFWHVSMLIDLDYEWWWPRHTAFTETARHFPRRSRALVHESIHYWHQLSHGYLLALAQEDWRRLLEWEQGGHPVPGPMREHHRQPEGRYRFSAHNLSECLARFWEVLFVGPQVVLRDALIEARRKSPSADVPEELRQLARQEVTDTRTFDMAMDVSGGYGAPFAVVSGVVGQRDALVVFPYLAHFALKTMRPAHFFERFLEEAAPAVAERAEALGIATSWNEDLVTALYPFASERCEQVLLQAGEPGLMHAPAMLADSGLADNEVYRWSFRRLESLAALEGAAAAEMAICLPAFDSHRTLLAVLLTPPCVRFRDGRSLGLGDVIQGSHAAEPSAEAAVAQAAEAARAATAAVLSIQQRWESFQDSTRGY